jgi:uncharacterized membrane protein YfcA
VGHSSISVGQQRPATACVAGGAASLLREKRWQALSPAQRRILPPLFTIALAPTLGGARLGTHLIQRFGPENSKKYLIR